MSSENNTSQYEDFSSGSSDTEKDPVLEVDEYGIELVPELLKKNIFDEDTKKYNTLKGTFRACDSSEINTEKFDISIAKTPLVVPFKPHNARVDTQEITGNWIKGQSKENNCPVKKHEIFPSEVIKEKVLNDIKTLELAAGKKNYYYQSLLKIADMALTMNNNQKTGDFVRGYLDIVNNAAKGIGFDGLIVHIDLPDMDRNEYQKTEVITQIMDMMPTDIQSPSGFSNLTDLLTKMLECCKNAEAISDKAVNAKMRQLTGRFRMLVKQVTQEGSLNEKGVSGESMILGDKLGSGGIGIIFDCEGKCGKRALKFRVAEYDFSFDKLEGFSELTQENPNLVSYYGSVKVNPWPFEIGTESRTADEYEILPPGVDHLRNYLDNNKGRISIKYFLEKIFYPIAKGVKAMHNKGFVHRDIKWQNIFVDMDDPDRYIALGDYDLTCKEGSLPYNIAGSPYYMAPEQARGGIITAKSDIYSMGKVLFKLYDRRGDEQHVGFMYSTESQEVKSLGLPKKLAQLVNDCIEPDINKRPDVDELIKRVESIIKLDEEDETRTNPSRGLKYDTNKKNRSAITPYVKIEEEEREISGGNGYTDRIIIQNRKDIFKLVLAAGGLMLSSGILGYECGSYTHETDMAKIVQQVKADMQVQSGRQKKLIPVSKPIK